MKKTVILFAMMLMSVSATVSALTPIPLRINGVTLDFIQNAVVPESMNEQFLKGVFCGLTSDLKDEEIIITDFKNSDNYIAAVLEVGRYYYVATYKPNGGIIDGALLLKNEDIVMGCDFLNPRGNQMNAKSPSITLEENMVSVTRNFITYVNAREKGGPIITEVGSVTSVYDIDKTGKISRGNGSQHSKWTVKANGSVPGNRGGMDVTESDECRTLGLGMNVISLYTDPISKEDKETPARMEILFKQFNEILARERDIDVVTVAKCLAELEITQEGMILRTPQLWLDWLDKNPNTKCMEALNKSLEKDEDFKAELQKVVKSLKDRKLRKAWQKRV